MDSVLHPDVENPVLAETDSAKIKSLNATPSGNVLQIEIDGLAASQLMQHKEQWRSVQIAIVGNQLDLDLQDPPPEGEPLPGMDDGDGPELETPPSEEVTDSPPRKEKKAKGKKKKK